MSVIFHIALQIICWCSLVLILYIYAIYPLIIALLARLFPKKVDEQPGNFTVSVLIACYNDAERLNKKIRDLLRVEGEDRIVQILIGSDGSTDQPDKVLSEIGDRRIQVHMYSARRGKPAVLNDLMQHVDGEVVVMMDARQRVDQKAIPSLLKHFSDPSIGVVSGELVFVKSLDDTSVSEGLGAYWRYEKWIRRNEAAFASVPGATGALYAIRKVCLRPLPVDMVLDDVILPMMAVVDGYRCIFDSGALVYDTPAKDYRRESIRKRRTIAGCIQLLFRFPRWCLPGGNPIAWQYASHKISRIFSPWLILVAFLSSICLIGLVLYQYLAGAIFLGVTLGLVIRFLQEKGMSIPLVGVLGVFTGMQMTIMGAWADFLRGRTAAAWEISERSRRSPEQ